MWRLKKSLNRKIKLVSNFFVIKNEVTAGEDMVGEGGVLKIF